MKKTYNAPKTNVVAVEVRSNLLDISAGGTASIKSDVLKGDAWTKQDQGWDLWGDDNDFDN